MSTLERIRKVALVAALASGVALAAATQGEERRAGDDHAAGTFANLGHLTVLAPRPAIADLGSMTVTARRLPDIRFADLGSMTVTASRATETFADLGAITVTASRSAETFADLGAMTVTAKRPVEARVADLGGITVTATRSGAVTVAAQPSVHSWN